MLGFGLVVTVASANTGIHVGSLWSASGQRLASANAGAPAPTSSAPADLPFQTSWIGNTNPGTDQRPHVSQNCTAGYVMPDGSAACISTWDEGAREGAVYKDGTPVTSLQWGHCCGGHAITADDRFLYVSVDSHGPWIRKYYHSGSFVPDGPGPLQTPSHAGAPPFGLAVVGDEVFAAVPSRNTVDVYRTSDLAYLRSFTVPGAGRMAADGGGRLWIRTGRQVRAYSTAGADLGLAVTDTVDPTAVAVSPQGELLVGDDGRDRQQVYVYDLRPAPVRVDTVGVAGGMFAGPVPGAAGPLRFNGIVGVGKDTAGRLFVMQDHPSSESLGTGTNIDVYRRTGATWTRDWQLLGLEFVDMADIDVASYHDGVVDAYTTNEHFRLDLNRPPGQQWTWVGQLSNRFDEPTDTDNGDLVPHVVYLGGQRFLATNTGDNGQITLRRFVPGTEYAHIVAQIGDSGVGTVDAHGDVWWAHPEWIGVARFTGLDAHGVPTFTSEQTYVDGLAPFSSIGRLRYDAAADAMYVTGFTEEHKHWDTADKVMGTVLARYDGWSRGNRTPRWTTVLPHFPGSTTEARDGLGLSAMDLAGGRIYASMLTGSGTPEQARMYAYDAATGAQVATWLPGPTVGQTGWTDLVDGVRAVALPDGETVVFQEEDRCAKIMMYRIQG